jgi:ribosome biogenesis GTPase
LNALDPALDLSTGELSAKSGTGRHTTVGSRLIELSGGGLVADTPGFNDVGLWSVKPEEVARCFPEMASLAQGCRYRSCSHVHEPECDVKAALANGSVAASRYESYCSLRREAEESVTYRSEPG